MKYFLLAGLLTFGISAYAGEKGNGGYSVVCRTEQGQMTSAQLLDIYEGQVIYKKSYVLDLNTLDDLVDLGRKRLSQYPSFLPKLDKELSAIHQNLIFIAEGNELEPTDDAFPPIKKKGCKFEQLANYQDSGEVLVSQEIWDQLDQVNRAGLILHEAIYSYRRKALGETTSANTRKLVAQLLASNPDASMIDKLVSDMTYHPNNKRACGLEGTLNERIESCSYIQPPTQWNMTLVTRTKELKEVWLDETNNLLISDRLSKSMDFDSARAACQQAHPEMGNITGLKWRLPKIEEYSRQSKAYMQTLPNLTRYNESFWFWTSSTKGRSVYIFNGQDGTIGAHPFKGTKSGSVRCVADL